MSPLTDERLVNIRKLIKIINFKPFTNCPLTSQLRQMKLQPCNKETKGQTLKHAIQIHALLELERTQLQKNLT